VNQLGTLRPFEEELPSQYSERVGMLYTEYTSLSYKRENGQFCTPLTISDFMAAQFLPVSKVLNLLDPAAGAGILSCSVCEHLVNMNEPPHIVNLDLYETDNELIPLLSKVISYLQRYLRAKGIRLIFKIYKKDFVLSNIQAYSYEPEKSNCPSKAYDLIIANPPYFRISNADPRFKAFSSIVYGQTNAYTLFMAVASRLLKLHGELIFIVPRSFASSINFKKFRKFFFAGIQPRLIHIFQSRKSVFKRDGVLQENIIIKGVNKHFFKGRNPVISISCSKGVDDINLRTTVQVQLRNVLYYKNEEVILRLPTNNEELNILELIDNLEGSIEKFGIKVSTGKVVPFRAGKLLLGVDSFYKNKAPLLWLQNIQPMRIDTSLKSVEHSYLKICKDSQKLLIPNSNYVILRRFSSKDQMNRLVAAPLLGTDFEFSHVGIENHLNYLYRSNGQLSEYECIGLSSIYNSSYYNTYFKTMSGSTQVSCAELHSFPLPSITFIIQLGKMVKSYGFDLSKIDKMILKYLLQADKTISNAITEHTVITL
jgi:adenine-specific DNA-methyltransferase